MNRVNVWWTNQRLRFIFRKNSQFLSFESIIKTGHTVIFTFFLIVSLGKVWFLNCLTGSLFSFVSFLLRFLLHGLLCSCSHLCHEVIGWWSLSNRGLLWSLLNLFWFFFLWFLLNLLFFFRSLFVFILLTTGRLRWINRSCLGFSWFTSSFILLHSFCEVIYFLFLWSSFLFLSCCRSSRIGNLLFLNWFTNDFVFSRSTWSHNHIFWFHCIEVKTHLAWNFINNLFTTGSRCYNFDFCWIGSWEWRVSNGIRNCFLCSVCSSFIISLDLFKFVLFFATAESLNLFGTSRSSNFLLLWHENRLLILVMDEEWQLIASNRSDHVLWE